MRRATEVGVALIAALVAACAGGDGVAADDSGAPASTSTRSGLPAPGDAEAARAALEAMPDQLAGNDRNGSDGEARYGSGTAAFGIEALDAADLDPNGGEVDREALAAMVVDPTDCEGAAVPCVAGGSGDGRRVTVWTSPDGAVAYAAVADSNPVMEQLLAAWRDAAAAVTAGS